MSHKIKIVTIIENDPITGVKYGEKEIFLDEIKMLFNTEKHKQKTHVTGGLAVTHALEKLPGCG